MHDPMQTVFDGAEAAFDALGHQEGCEHVLRRMIDPLLAKTDRSTEQAVLALVSSMAHWREMAEAEIRRLQALSMGRTH